MLQSSLGVVFVKRDYVREIKNNSKDFFSLVGPELEQSLIIAELERQMCFVYFMHEIV